MTFNQIVTEIIDTLNLSDDALPRIRRRVNEVYREVTSSAVVNPTSRRASVSASTAIGSAFVTFLGVEKVLRVADGNGTELGQLTQAEVQSRPNAETPSVWAVYRVGAGYVTVQLDAVAQDEIPLIAHGYELADTLSDEMEPAFPADFHGILIEGVLAKEYRKQEKLPESRLAKQEYDDKLHALNHYLQTSETALVKQGRSRGVSTVPASSGAESVAGKFAYTQTALLTFDRDPLVPFAVTPGSAPVDNLDLTFLQSGDDAVPRSLIGKVRETLSVTDFGAVGDGTTDDTAAIQAAVVRAGLIGASLVFPGEGLYRTGRIAITAPLRIAGQRARLLGTGVTLFSVTQPISGALEIEGFAGVEFEGAAGVVGRQFFTNAAHGGNYDAEETAYLGEYHQINPVADLTIRDCRLGYAKLTIVDDPGAPTMRVRVRNNRWIQPDDATVHAAPYYCLFRNVEQPVLEGNDFEVMPPDGDNEDIVKITGGSTDADITDNLFRNLNPACESAQLDLFAGGSRARVLRNRFRNAQAHIKAWGDSGGGQNYQFMKVEHNAFRRDPGFLIANNLGSGSPNMFVYALNTRASISFNEFVDFEDANEIRCIHFDNRPEPFDDTGALQAAMIRVIGNFADLSGSHEDSAFLAYEQGESDTTGAGVIAANVLRGGRWFIRAFGQIPSSIKRLLNSWHERSGAATTELDDTIRIWNTDDGEGNFQRFEVLAETTRTRIRQTQGGSGAGLPLAIGPAGSTNLIFVTSNQDRWQITAGGHLAALDGHYIEMREGSEPTAPSADRARLFVQDDGAGKTRLCVRFPSGASQVIATEP